jgi:RNA polymerase sigma-70 factor (ECF subfamily)
MATSEQQFAAVFSSCYSPIASYSMRRIPNPSEVDDVVGEVFMTAWRRWDEVSQIENPLPWLYGVAGNVIRNRKRSVARQLRLVDKIGAEPRTRTVDPVDVLAGEVTEALERLSFDDREVLQLVAWEGLSHIEAGEVLGCTPNAVALRLSRARKRLATYLEPTEVPQTTHISNAESKAASNV